MNAATTTTAPPSSSNLVPSSGVAIGVFHGIPSIGGGGGGGGGGIVGSGCSSGPTINNNNNINAASSSSNVHHGALVANAQRGGGVGSDNSNNGGRPLWEYDVNGIENWIRRLAPGVPNTGGMLFPAVSPHPATTTSNGHALGNALLSNLTGALSCASSHGRVGGGVTGEPDLKRLKVEAGVAGGDVYRVLDPSFARSGRNDDDGGGGSSLSSSELSAGAILSRITLGGLVNGLSGMAGGIVDSLTCIPFTDLSQCGGGGVGHVDGGVNDAARKKEERKRHMEMTVPTAGNITVRELIQLARGLHRSIAARTEMDILATTPRRIADLLCPEISDAELKSIRRRVHDTVVLGLGTHSSANAASLEDETSEIPVSASVRGHEIEQWKRCHACGNNDQSMFVLDGRNGDVVCTNCGAVVSESIMHEGSQYRKFEGEEDRNHHGDSPNPLFSNSHNMATTLGGMSFQPGAGMGGYGSAGRGGIENILRNAHAYTEMNISQFGKEEKKTRIGYKDRQKKDAFYQMAHAGDALGLHEAVVQRAKELFAGFRDDREMVQQFKGVIAACLSEAFDQLSRDGKQLLKKIAGESSDEVSNLTHARASRRKDLHSASLAGKGGLLLDTTVVSHGGVGVASMDEKSTKDSLTGQPFETKSAATWDLQDCKSWMIEAIKSIARSWVETRQSSTAPVVFVESKNGTHDSTMAIPNGTKDELEGILVEHTLKICEYLESELKQKSDGKSKPTMGELRVNTPRVGDMGVLGIKWQHSYERGSGGKGGVGNSGRTISGIKPGERSSRTAGQILLLLTAKRFGNIIGHQAAGAAFHKELKAVIGREDARQRLERRDEATKARLKQMNRKPWLQKRVQL